jgi:predicted DNA-binding transcriptional regulator AlpA
MNFDGSILRLIETSLLLGIPRVRLLNWRKRNAFPGYVRFAVSSRKW